MLNKLSGFIREQELIVSGDLVTCAVSGGADSVALLFGLYLLKDKMGFSLAAAHFNHHLRGAESDRDEAFVRKLCEHFDIPLTVGHGDVRPGSKGLEAAARDARYAFLRQLTGKIATAHTADDNAETVLMHMLRGSGLKGLGAIAPVNGSIIRPMLMITRRDVEAFLQEYYLSHVEDSSNAGDSFLRNRIRHEISPILTRENPSFAVGASSMALRLRQDEDFIRSRMEPELPAVSALRGLHPALRKRYLERFLKENGVSEPEQSHIAVAEELVFSEKPSARADLPGGIRIARNYDRLEIFIHRTSLPEVILPERGSLSLPEWGVQITVCSAGEESALSNRFTAEIQGKLVLRSRRAGDSLRLSGGTKSVKKLMIDRKIPAAERDRIPVIADDSGVIGVFDIGANLDRVSSSPSAIAVCIGRI